jgi:hypothetical protein
MSVTVLFLVAALATSPQANAEPTPPKLIRVVPGDSGVYVDFERRAEDVERRVRYCVYMAEEPGGPHEQVARFWAGLYRGGFGHTNGYIGHLTNGKPYYFAVTVQSDGKESVSSEPFFGRQKQCANERLL